MNRTQTIRGIAERSGVPRRDVEKVMDALAEVVGLALACGESVGLRGFGSFTAWQRESYTYVLRGEATEKAAYRKIGFRPSETLKARVNR